MEDDDEFLVVIVGDEGEDQEDNQPLLHRPIKEEILDEEVQELDSDGVERLIESAERHGMLLPLEDSKKESGEIKEEIIFDEASEDELYNPDDEGFSQSDEEYLNDKKKTLKGGRKKSSEPHRHKMLKPSEQKSYVKELRNNYPELKEDKELLIEALCSIMQSSRPPPPPENYYVMSEDLYQCTSCGHEKDTEPAIFRHWQESHGERYLICLACGVDFRSRTNLYKHEKRCNAPDATIVLKARARFVGRKGRGRPFLPPKHLAPIGKYMMKTTKVYGCSMCAAQFKSLPACEAHERMHRGSRPFLCAHCPAAYAARTALLRHVNKHMGLVFVCDICSRQLSSKNALITHMHTHLPEKKFGCECGRRYATKMALTEHINRVHLQLPPPCPCQICPKRFPRMSLLRTHMQKAHGMDLITKRMFYKSFPLLSKTQVEEAKIVMKSEQRAIVRPIQTAEDNEYDRTLKEIEEASRKERQERDERVEVNVEYNDTENDPTQDTFTEENATENNDVTEENLTETDEKENQLAFLKDKKFSLKIMHYIDDIKKSINPNVKCVVIQNGEVMPYTEDISDKPVLAYDDIEFIEDDPSDLEDDKEAVREQIKEMEREASRKKVKGTKRRKKVPGRPKGKKKRKSKAVKEKIPESDTANSEGEDTNDDWAASQSPNDDMSASAPRSKRKRQLQPRDSANSEVEDTNDDWAASKSTDDNTSASAPRSKRKRQLQPRDSANSEVEDTNDDWAASKSTDHDKSASASRSKRKSQFQQKDTANSEAEVTNDDWAASQSPNNELSASAPRPKRKRQLQPRDSANSEVEDTNDDWAASKSTNDDMSASRSKRKSQFQLRETFEDDGEVKESPKKTLTVVSSIVKKYLK